MFCAGCGTQIQSGLNYCNRCGRRIVDDLQFAGGRSNPTVVAGRTAGVGFISYIFVLLVMSRSALAPDVYIPVTLFYFACLFGLCFMFLRQGRSTRQTSRTPAEESFTSPNYLRPVDTAQLEEARDFGIGSVTDATTRTLNEVPIGKFNPPV
jgi:hypothetical protein